MSEIDSETKETLEKGDELIKEYESKLRALDGEKNEYYSEIQQYLSHYKELHGSTDEGIKELKNELKKNKSAIKAGLRLLYHFST